jgi:hypothetical protein
MAVRDYVVVFLVDLHDPKYYTCESGDIIQMNTKASAEGKAEY